MLFRSLAASTARHTRSRTGATDSTSSTTMGDMLCSWCAAIRCNSSCRRGSSVIVILGFVVDIRSPEIGASPPMLVHHPGVMQAPLCLQGAGTSPGTKKGRRRDGPPRCRYAQLAWGLKRPHTPQFSLHVTEIQTASRMAKGTLTRLPRSSSTTACGDPSPA